MSAHVAIFRIKAEWIINKYETFISVERLGISFKSLVFFFRQTLRLN